MSIYLGTNAISMGGFSKVMLGANQIWAAAAGQTKAQLAQSLGGILYFDALKADGSGLPSNSPFLTTWTDLINAYDSDLTNFAGTTASGWDATDPANPVLNFDGANDYLMTALEPVNFPDSFTIFMRIKTDTVNTSTKALVAMPQGTQANGNFRLLKDSSKKLNLRMTDNANVSGTTITSTTVLADNTVYYCAITYDSSNRQYKLYVNGTQEGSAATLTNPRGTPTGNMVVGAYYSSGNLSGYWDAGIMSVAVFNAVLASTDLSDLISAGI